MEASHSTSLVYAPLESGRIRLLRIRSSTGARIDCEIKHFDLDSDVEWRALSYVWGTASPSESVLVDGHAKQPGHLPITPHLLAGLRAIHQNFGDKWFWIDAICINQDDGAEKAVQVSHMGHIYRRAATVAVWFGEMPNDRRIVTKTLEWLQAHWLLRKLRGDGSAEDFEEAAQHVKAQGPQDIDTMSRYCCSQLDACSEELETDHHVPERHLMTFRSLLETLANAEYSADGWKLLNREPFKDDLLPAEHLFWIALAELLSNEWFRRVWTYQEIKLARGAYLLFDDCVILWTVLYRCRATVTRVVIHQVGILLEAGQFNDRGLDAITISTTMMHTPIASSSTFTPESLGSLLRQTRFRIAKNPRDQVYGILGLVEHKTRSAIVVDYSLPTAHVFAAAFSAAIQEGSIILPLLWLAFEAEIRVVEDLPSWCPDFSDYGLASLIQASYYFFDDAVIEKYSELAQVGHTVNWSDFFDSAPFVHLGQGMLAPLQVWVREDYSKWLLALHEMISCDKLAHYLHCTHGEDDVPDFWDLVHFCEDVMVHEIPAEKVLEERFREQSEVQMLVSKMCTFIEEFGGMNVFQTASGKIGVSRRRICLEDKIILVPGGRTLFVLSSDKKYYRGTTHVKELMGNSLLDLPDELKDAWEMVELL